MIRRLDAWGWLFLIFGVISLANALVFLPSIGLAMHLAQETFQVSQEIGLAKKTGSVR